MENLHFFILIDFPAMNGSQLLFGFCPGFSYMDFVSSIAGGSVVDKSSGFTEGVWESLQEKQAGLFSRKYISETTVSSYLA